MSVELGRILITYEATADDIITDVEVDGDIPLVVQLGLLRMAEDTLLARIEYPDDDDA